MNIYIPAICGEYNHLIGTMCSVLTWLLITLVLSLPVLSETTESTEEEWQSIADLAAACRSILEALSREGEGSTLEGLMLKGLTLI